MYWFFLVEHNAYAEIVPLIERLVENISVGFSDGLSVDGGRIKSSGDRVIEAVLNVYRKKLLLGRKKVGAIYFTAYVNGKYAGIVVGEMDEDAFHTFVSYILMVLPVRLAKIPLLELLKHFKNADGVRVMTATGEYPLNELDDNLLPSITGFAVGDLVVKENYAYSRDKQALETIARHIILR